MSEHIRTVSDASVLIDIEEGKLANSMFSLSGTSFCVPDVLFEKELRKNHSHLCDLGLELCTLSGESVASVFAMAQKHREVSRMDLFALQLARGTVRILLTGDKFLRKLAESYEVECHGTIWLVERMVKQQVIRPAVARTAYSRMREAGSRLPWEKAEQGLQEIENRYKRQDLNTV